VSVNADTPRASSEPQEAVEDKFGTGDDHHDPGDQQRDRGHRGRPYPGFELENLAAGIANAKGLPGAAAGTFLGGTTFLTLAVGAVISPIQQDSRA